MRFFILWVLRFLVFIAAQPWFPNVSLTPIYVPSFRHSWLSLIILIISAAFHDQLITTVLTYYICLFLLFQTSLIHLGAKYAPCMRWDEVLDRDIKEERLKERDTACCIRKDRAGCVQSPKTECSKVGIGGPNEDLEGGMDGNGGSVGGVPPRSNWVRVIDLMN